MVVATKAMSSTTTNALFLALLITINGVMTASSINCRRSANCSCMMNNNQRMDVEFTCNTYDDTTTSIRISGTQKAEIQCGYHERPTFPPDVHIGNVTKVEVSYCAFSQTLTQLLGNLGIKSMQVLIVNDGIVPAITRDFLNNIENVTELSLMSNGITTIEEDAFCQLPRLKQLDLTRNSINLTANMFDCLQSLVVLELPTNGITELPEGIFKQLKKLRILYLWGNRLKRLNPRTFEHLTDLALLELSSNQLEALPSGIFDSLINLRQLNLNNNKIKTAPAHLLATNVNLRTVRWDSNVGLQLDESTFANLTKLENVSLVANDFVTIPEGLFQNSTNIKTINLARNSLGAIPKGLFDGLVHLTTLDLSFNRIERFENGTFDSLKALENLFLQNNRIVDLSIQLFYDLIELRTLRLDYNRLATLPPFPSQRNLKALNASHNIIWFEDNMSGASPLNRCTDLEELDLSYNEITYFERDFMIILVQLRFLDLSFNYIESISVNLLQKVDTHERRINLSNNNITYVDFSQAEFMASLQDDLDAISSNLYNTVVLLSNNPITCDCNAYDLWRYYNDKFDPRVRTMITILKDEVRCPVTDYLVAELLPTYFTCTLEELLTDFKCPQNCSCSWIPHGKEISYNCSNSGLKTLPPIKLPRNKLKFDTLEVDLKWNQLKTGPTEDSEGYANVTRLLLSHNQIDRVEWVPPRIEVLKLDYNNLTALDYDVMKSLNGSLLKSLSLDHNPWKCRCSALNLTKFVIHRLKQIENPNITCNATTTRIIDLSEREVCKSHTVLILSVTSTVICICFLVALGSALFYRNQQVIKVWLYTHNLLLWWVTEEEVDKDKKYDLFICFSHKDDDFVREQLLPELENGPEKYKVCIHYRDWIAGEFIATQIADSVQNSRRTLIVLSRNFLDSVWGKMEFRIAHKQSMAEGRARVIVMVYGDVDLKQDLDEELKAYIKTNTYIKWDDPWFWKRLKYALPHSQKKLNNCQINMQQNGTLLQEVDLLKGNPIAFTIQNEKTAEIDTGLNPLLK